MNYKTYKSNLQKIINDPNVNEKIKAELRQLLNYGECAEASCKLPCSIGDTIYRLDIDNLEMEPIVIENILITKDDIIFRYDNYDGVICHLLNITEHTLYLDNYFAFLTKKEAEAKQNELYSNKKLLIDLKERIPCNIGDKIWYIPPYYLDFKKPEILFGNVEEIRITKNDYGIVLKQIPYESFFYGKNYNNWWFTDETKAKKRLEELK